MFVEDEPRTSLAQGAASQSHYHFVASISKSSTPLGRCLESVLLSMKMSNSTKDPKQKNSREKDTAANVDEEGFSEEQAALDSDAIHSISKAFGGPMARLQIRESRRLSQRLTTETSSEHSDYAKGERSPRSAPRALLYGRLDHYNRIGQNWRLVVENVRVTKRKQLLRERTKRKRCSLWRAASIPPVGCRDERNQECNEGRNLVFHECEEIQILGYDDL